MKLTSQEQAFLNRTTGLDIYRYPLLSPENATLGNWRVHGLANRVLLDEPKSTILGSMLMCRWVWNQDARLRLNKRRRENYFHFVLEAVGTKDAPMLAAMQAALPAEALWSGNDPESMLYETLMRLVQRQFAEAADKGKVAIDRSRDLPAWDKPIAAALSAIAEDQVESLKIAIKDCLAGVRRIRAIDPIFKVVYPVPHHLWHLAEYARPGMLDGWAPTSGLPWDQAYHDLVQSIDNASDVIPQADIPEVFRPLFEVVPWDTPT